ncbi:MAG: aryl-sulfate sulfotransferase [Planctomycetes bacterium]|nr:aryl-sulfate sulfotransferase [Planctomycetota bacterium]
MLSSRLAGSALLALTASVAAQAPGLRLFAPLGAAETQLVDGQGTVVHTWPGVDAVSVYMRPDGSIVRGMVAPGVGIPGTTGQLQELDIDGNVTWDVLISNTQRLMHHDIEIMPNGNILVIAVDLQTPADAIAEGRDPSTISGPFWLPESLLEIEKTGPTSYNVVWEWHAIDHVVQEFDNTKPNYGVVSNHPELVDINYPPEFLTTGDWTHGNGIDYDPIHDWILFSQRSSSEVWLIDHSTTTAEAAGHTGGARGKGGDLLWRWGNSEAYGRGGPNDMTLRHQHDPRFIPPGYPGAGNITFFDNDYILGASNQSAIVEITMPLDVNGMPFIDPITNRFGPDTPVWTYTAPGFYSAFVSSGERLQNGNTLICAGQTGVLFEIDPSGQTMWSYSVPGAPFVFQAQNVDRRLWATGDAMSVAGGRVEFVHLVDTERDGDLYFLLGSLTGTAPGFVMPGGLLVPLNIDILTTLMATSPNNSVFDNTNGLLDATGSVRSAVDVPNGVLDTWMIGLEMNFAHVIISGGVAVEVSNLVTVTIAM